MSNSEKSASPKDEEVNSDSLTTPIYKGENRKRKKIISHVNLSVKWYRSTFYNALILGLCNFLAPGIWGAMNSLGGGGEEEPYLVNA